MSEPGSGHNPGWEDAYDVLTGAGVDPDKAASLALAAVAAGRDPAAWARKYVTLRQAARSTRPGR